ncbi:MAG: hypothetical protein KAS66_05095 [Candidatus Omnitrophica bacterium]|nr:hypothetical protein [Candidatus Omnitrophota bacterium]
MSILDLSGQQAAYNLIAPKIQDLKEKMDLRKQIWDKLPASKKIAWIQSDKDPIMGLAWTVYKYLRNNFFGSETDEYL